MGCVVPWSHVNYKIDDSIGTCTPIDELFDKTQLMHGSIISSCGNSEYVDVSDKHVSIFDTKSGKYVKVKKVIRNRYNGILKRVRGSAGRVVEITPDHPLPVNGKGRVRADELVVGDAIQLADNIKPVSKSNIIDDPDMAWLLGLIICDGSYANNIVISVGVDETDIIDKVKYVCDKYGYHISISEQNRGIRGHYFDINLVMGVQLAVFRLKLALLFRGIRKVDRRVPECIMTADDDIRSAFLAGMIDADGYLYNNKSTVYSLGSANQYLAYGEFQLANSLGLVARMYTNNYTPLKEKLRYNNEFDSSELINSYIACAKKKITNSVYVRSISYSDTKVNSIEDIQYTGYVYDVETESDTFDFNGICSHNCRTRVIGNIHDPSRQTTSGRGNLSFTTVNLPRIALELMNKELSQEEKIDEFFRILDTRIDLVFRQLIHRLKIQSNKQVKNYPFLMGEGIWMDSDKLGMDDKIGEILKHGTLTVGFIGLAETLIGLIGKHHGESEEAQELGLKIVGRIRERCDEESEKTKLNFSLIATPAESLSGRFVNIDKKKYGEVAGVTDRGYYTNSAHIPVYYPIKAFQKIKLEAPYHAFCNAGHIAYTELDGDPSQNLEAFESIIRYMHDCGIGYGSINHPVDRDPVCGYVGVINDVCPRCGRRDGEELSDEQMEALRRKYGRAIPTRCC